MRTDNRKKHAASSSDHAHHAWREELLGNALEILIGAGRLMDTAQSGPPPASPPRNRKPPRRSR